MGCPRASYRPRQSRQSALHRLVRDHFEQLKAVYAERFAPRYGPWQPHWDRIVQAFLRCGDACHGFARVRCEDCGDERIVAFSCKARGFCPSCEAKRRAAWAEHVLTSVLPHLPYAMIVFTVPRCLRRIFLRERALLGELSQVAFESTRDFFAAQFPGNEGVPYFVSSIQTAGDLANPMPHLHCIASLGIRTADGTFHALPENVDFTPLEQLFRHRVLSMLRKKERLSEAFHRRLLNWKHSGFSAHVKPTLAPDDREGLERIVCYALRPPLSLKRLTYEPGASTGIYRGKYNPSRGDNFQVMDPKEFLALLFSHVPQPYEVRIRYCGAASSAASAHPAQRPGSSLR